MANQTITGKIIRIIDNRTIIVNLGYKDGITEDSFFLIIGEPEIIYDPFSGQILGSVNVLKTKVKASSVYEKFTIATSHFKDIRNPAIGLGSLSELISSVNKDLDVNSLNVDPAQLQPWKAKSESEIKLGDVVTVEVDIKDEENKE